MIRPIETRYAGCRFRSRLEARWAVFLDVMGIDWEYEKEGYELPSGRYLPDFWLPEQQIWLEIKGSQPTASEVGLARELVMATGSQCVIQSGLPSCDVHNLGIVASRRSVFAAEQATSARFEYGEGATRYQKSALQDFPLELLTTSCPWAEGDRLHHAKFGPGTVRAVDGSKAQVAFEHDETPARWIVWPYLKRPLWSGETELAHAQPD